MMRWLGSILCISLAVIAGCVLSETIHLSDNTVNALGQQDTTLQLLGQLVSVLDRLAAVDHNLQMFNQRLTSLDQRFDSFDQRLNALDQRVESRVNELKDRVDTLLAHSSSKANTVMQDLRAVCAELSDVTGNVMSSVNDVKPPSTTKGPQIPFRVTRVEKMETADFYRVKVAYEGSTKPIVLFAKIYYMPFTSLPEKTKLGMIEFDIPKGPNADRPYLLFMYPDHQITVVLNLNSTLSAMDIPRLDFEVLQGKDIQFQPGQEVELDITFNIDGDMDSIQGDDVITRILIKSDTEDNVINRYQAFKPQYSDFESVQLITKEAGGSKGHLYWKGVLNSTDVDVEGILELMYKVIFNCSGDCLVEEIRDTRSVKFYRKDHEGPFVKNFIGFIHDDFRGDNSQFICDTDLARCLIYCEVLGDGLLDVEITRVFLDEDMPTDDISLLNGIWGSSQLFIRNVSFDDAGDFRCTARSLTRTVTEQLTLNVIKAAKIDRDISNVTTFENGSLLATCVAEGIPTPNVTFQDFNATDDRYVIQVTHPSQSQTRTDLFISDPDLVSDLFGWISCHATNVKTADSTMYGEFDDLVFLYIDNDYSSVFGHMFD